MSVDPMAPWWVALKDRQSVVRSIVQKARQWVGRTVLPTVLQRGRQKALQKADLWVAQMDRQWAAQTVLLLADSKARPSVDQMALQSVAQMALLKVV